MAATSAGISGHFALPMGKKDTTAGKDKEVDETTREGAKRSWLLSRYTSASEVRGRWSLLRRVILPRTERGEPTDRGNDGGRGDPHC